MNIDKLDFVKVDNVSSFLDSLIQDVSKKNKENLVSTFSPFDLAMCPRRLIYLSNGKKHDFYRNTYFEDNNRQFLCRKWISYLEKSSKIKVLKKEESIADANCNLAGKLDAVINMGGHIFSVKFKFVNSLDFSKVTKDKPFKRDIIESMTYSWLAETEGGLLIYENNDTQDYLVFHVKNYKPIIQSIKEKCVDLYGYKVKGVIPVRAYKNKISKECKQCEFKVSCWKEGEKT